MSVSLGLWELACKRRLGLLHRWGRLRAGSYGAWFVLVSLGLWELASKRRLGLLHRWGRLWAGSCGVWFVLVSLGLWELACKRLLDRWDGDRNETGLPGCH